jgi:hypothetical protein
MSNHSNHAQSPLSYQPKPGVLRHTMLPAFTLALLLAQLALTPIAEAHKGKCSQTSPGN